MSEDFNLSEKMFTIEQTESEKEYCYKSDIKEFIKRLKEETKSKSGVYLVKEIDKLSGGL